MTQSSESGSNGGSQNNSTSGSSGSSGQASTDSDSSGSGVGCEGSTGSDSPPCRNHIFNNKNSVRGGILPSENNRLCQIQQSNNSTPQVVVTRAVININPQVKFIALTTYRSLEYIYLDM